MFENFENNYYIVNDKFVAKGIKSVWGGISMLVKLENDDNYVDDILKNKDNFSELNNIIGEKILTNCKGLMLITNKKDNIKKIKDEKDIIKSFMLMGDENKNRNIDVNKIINQINNDLMNIPRVIRYEEKIEIIPEEIDTQLIARIFNEDKLLYTEMVDKEDVVDILECDVIEKIKNKITNELTEQDNFDMQYYHELDNSLMYKYPTQNEYTDILSFGKKIIEIIIEKLSDYERGLEDKNGNIIEIFEEYTLFSFLEFSVVGEYIEITKKCNKDNPRKITKEIVPDLIYMTRQYDRN